MKSDVPEFYISVDLTSSSTTFVLLPSFRAQRIRLVYASIVQAQAASPGGPGYAPGWAMFLTVTPGAGNGEYVANQVAAEYGGSGASNTGFTLGVNDKQAFEGNIEIQLGQDGQVMLINHYPIGVDPADVTSYQVIGTFGFMLTPQE